MPITNKHVLLDTCIYSNLQSTQSDLARQTQKLLEELIQNNNKLYFSEFTRHELLRSATQNKRKKIQELLESFIEVPSSQSRLERATQLYSAYKNNPKVCTGINSISDIDVFIGALIFHQQKPLLLTADYADFPRPFFSTNAKKRIEYKNKKNNFQSIYYYFFEADLKSILKATV